MEIGGMSEPVNPSIHVRALYHPPKKIFMNKGSDDRGLFSCILFAYFFNFDR